MSRSADVRARLALDADGMALDISRVRIWSNWPRWIGYATAGWSLGYGTLGLVWALGGPGFPWQRGDPLVIAVLGFLGAAIACGMARSSLRGAARTVGSAFGWSLAGVLVLGVADERLLIAIGYAVPTLIGAPFGWYSIGEYVEQALPWPVVNQLICLAGGVGWALTTLAYRRRTGTACERCGRTSRSGSAASWMSAESAARWGRWATYAACVVPSLYAVERLAWAVRIPLGGSEELVDFVHSSGAWLAGVGLACMAIVGVVLTIGLVRRWGEVFPRWMIGLAGRRVPPMLAVVPASLVSIALVAGMRPQLERCLGSGDCTAEGMNWLGLATMWLLPVWGVLLAVATLGYYLRRRERCQRCGRL